MMHLLGYHLELVIDSVLARQEGPVLCAAHNAQGQLWLVYRAAPGPSTTTWMCSPVSERALRAVVSRGSEPRDAMRHSLTGTVDILQTIEGRAVPDRCVPCAQIPEELLPPVGLGNQLAVTMHPCAAAAASAQRPDAAA
jgi:hypothetical protein